MYTKHELTLIRFKFTDIDNRRQVKRLGLPVANTNSEQISAVKEDDGNIKSDSFIPCLMAYFSAPLYNGSLGSPFEGAL